MDLLQLPSISDDELDYDLDVPADGANATLKPQRASNNNEAQKETSTAKKVLFVDASKNRKRRSQENAWPNSPDEKEDSDREWPSGEEEEGADAFEGRLAGRVKRVASRTDDEAEQNNAAERFGQILGCGKPSSTRRKLSDAALEALYNSLDADPDDGNLRFNALFVHCPSVDQMNTFDISRIFAEFDPQTVRSLEGVVRSSVFVVTFESPFDVAQFLLDNSKPLRRIRAARRPEEGELVESEDEEEGQVKEEDGDDVAVVKETVSKPKRSESDVVEVNVQSVKVPPGKWRVVVKHVPDNKLVLVRIATGLQIRTAVIASRNCAQQTPEGQFDDGSNFKNTKIRPGLNVFDEKGNELDWDYEHDTRFFEEGDWATDKMPVGNAKESGTAQTTDAAEQAKAIEAHVKGMKIRSRGRGAKKFLQALASDDDE
ncbi:hypothetical protein niasHT_037062 [Heterodera trifolii]|uniref:RRM domain-containing protein n=1 Tax=Heterodera trifolii TaxID=157864 RepID=A0ABD2IPA4_9BILA